MAVELDRQLRKPLTRMLREDLPRSRDVRWCSEGQLHVTLKFLGDARDEQVPGICEAISAVSVFIEPFTLRLDAVGCFPSSRSPRVLWCGLDDPENGCSRWLDLADPLFEELGFPRETRAYHPHITLGRVKTPAGGKLIRRLLDEVPAPEAPAMTVEEVVLFESQLSPSGALYTPRFKARFGR